MCKSWLRSKTIVINVLAAVLAALEAQWHLLSPHLPEGWQSLALLGLALTNAYLRAITFQPVSWSRDSGRHDAPTGYDDTGSYRP